LAVEARKIDMRASPYDVSAFAELQSPLCVETNEGRKAYIKEQERLREAAAPIRQELIHVLDTILANGEEGRQ